MHNAYCITMPAAENCSVAMGFKQSGPNPMTETEMQMIADELTIRRVLDEYCLRLEVSPFEEWLDLFTDDTVYEVYRQCLRGREELSAKREGG